MSIEHDNNNPVNAESRKQCEAAINEWLIAEEGDAYKPYYHAFFYAFHLLDGSVGEHEDRAETFYNKCHDLLNLLASPEARTAIDRELGTGVPEVIQMLSSLIHFFESLKSESLQAEFRREFITEYWPLSDEELRQEIKKFKRQTAALKIIKAA